MSPEITPEIRILSIKSPWIWWILNRTRGIPANIKHHFDPSLQQFFDEQTEFLGFEIRKRGYPFRGLTLLEESVEPDTTFSPMWSIGQVKHPGQVIGYAYLVGVQTITTPDQWERLKPHSREPGPFPGPVDLILFKNPQRIENPFHIRGRLGLCKLKDEERSRISDHALLAVIEAEADRIQTTTGYQHRFVLDRA